MSEQRGLLGTSIVGFGKPAPKLEIKAGSYFLWLKQFITWAVTNTCDDVLMETSDPIVLQSRHAISREEIEFRHGPNKEASVRRAFEGITAASPTTCPFCARSKTLAALDSRWQKFDGITSRAMT